MQFFQWLATNWASVAGVIGAAYTLWKLGTIITAIVRFINSVLTRFTDAEKTLALLATNHLPHLQAELEKFNSKQERTNEVLSEIREDLRLVLFEKIHHDE